MNGEADCPTDLEMAAPKGQGRGPQLVPSLNLTFLTQTHQLLRFFWAAVCELGKGLKFTKSSSCQFWVWPNPDYLVWSFYVIYLLLLCLSEGLGRPMQVSSQ